MSSSRKRKAPEPAGGKADGLSSNYATAPATEDAGEKQPLVWVTKASLKEMRQRLRLVADETKTGASLGIDGSSGLGAAMGRSRSSNGGAAVGTKQDPVIAAYLRAFQTAVAGKVQAMCEVQDPRESREEDKLFEDVTQFCDDLQAARARLTATRARVARLSAATCVDALRVSEAADDRACSILESSMKHARMEEETGCPLPLVSTAASGSGGGGSGNSRGGDGESYEDDDDHNYHNADIVGAQAYSGVDASVLEPKVSKLIGKLSELPGPLKALLQEIPELTASLAVSVQNVEAVMRAGNSRAEALLGKAPPTPLPGGRKKKNKAVASGGVDDERPPPEDVRLAAREARVEQAKKQWQAEGVGVVGGMFN